MRGASRLTRIEWGFLIDARRTEALARPGQARAVEIASVVRGVRDQVVANGDRALSELTARFDGVEIDRFELSGDTLSRSLEELDRDDRAALERAICNIESFHRAQASERTEVTTEPGVECHLETRPLESVGLYVPGGTAPLVSTLLMLAVPARLAGCDRRVVCTPPGQDGQVPSVLLAAASLCSVSQVFRVGGAQSIAALAYGTQTIARVDKIFGPGNAYVAAAKQLVSSDPGGPAVDLPAGPSEVLVVADDTAAPSIVAADLLSQAEHDSLSQVVLVTPSARLVDRVDEEIVRQLESLPRRAIVEAALANARAVLVADVGEAVEVSNRYAPEHLILNCADADRLVPSVRHAGSVFVGSWTAEAFGDYASGANHVLPTYGAARSHSGLTLSSFHKTMTVQRVTPDGLEGLGPTVERLARLEGLEAHARAVELRRRAFAESERVRA